MNTPPSPPPREPSASAWTEARLRRLVSLWNTRLSSARIARALGPGFSRSAVIGKLYRLGLCRTGEQRNEAQARGGRHVMRRRGPPVLPEAPLPPPTPCVVVPRLIGILELTPSTCRWPCEVDGQVRFCGHGVRARGPYCVDHHRIAYGAVLPPLTLETIQAADRRRGVAGPPGKFL